MLLAQLERSREQLLESERSLRDVQAGDLTRGWGAHYNLSPPKKCDFYDQSLYENWDFYDQSLWKLGFLWSNSMRIEMFLTLWKLVYFSYQLVTPPGFLNQRTRVGGCYFQQTNRKRSKKAGDLGIVTFFQWLFLRFHHHTYRVHVRYIYLHLPKDLVKCKQIYRTWILWVMANHHHESITISLDEDFVASICQKHRRRSSESKFMQLLRESFSLALFPLW